MPWKTPEEHTWNGARILDITSRLPVLTPAQENAAMYDWWSENVVQLTQKWVQDMMTWNEERESQHLEITLQWLYIELDREIKILEQHYSKLEGIPTDLSAWENNNNQIFTTISSIESGWIYSETDSMLENTGENILTEGFFQEKFNNTTGKEALLTIKTSKGVKIKEIKEDGTPQIRRMDYSGINEFVIRFIYQKQYQPTRMQTIVHMGLYDDDNQLQDYQKTTTISEKKIMELCYIQAIQTVKIFTHQLKFYK